MNIIDIWILFILFICIWKMSIIRNAGVRGICFAFSPAVKIKVATSSNPTQAKKHPYPIGYGCFWRSERDLNPHRKCEKALRRKGFSIFVVIFVVILRFVAITEVGGEGIFIAILIPFGYVGIDPIHGGTVCPAADLHCHLRGDVQNMAQ